MGLSIDNAHLPSGYAPGTLFHPTFLYECLWNVAGVAVLLLIDRRIKVKSGQLFASYIMVYTLGRCLLYTSNPSFSVISPLLSRSLLLTLHALSSEDLSLLLDRSLASESGLKSLFSLSADARSALLRLAGADARKALTLLEAAAASCLERGGEGQLAEERSEPREIEIADVENAANQALVRWDQDQQMCIRDSRHPDRMG